ncbi:MAG: hypothetical protein VYA83_04065 [Candidatus Neomarinimicrobiota bacterium]|nr:hypothetical protein [Candidatus Neomarinimicrobiota bacterium]
MDFIKDYFFTLVVFIVPIIYSIQPLFLPAITMRNTSDNRSALSRKKNILYRQIKELEMEYDIGNLDKQDFLLRRSELKAEVSSVLFKLKKK